MYSIIHFTLSLGDKKVILMKLNYFFAIIYHLIWMQFVHPRTLIWQDLKGSVRNFVITLLCPVLYKYRYYLQQMMIIVHTFTTRTENRQKRFLSPDILNNLSKQEEMTMLHLGAELIWRKWILDHPEVQWRETIMTAGQVHGRVR